MKPLKTKCRTKKCSVCMFESKFLLPVWSNYQVHVVFSEDVFSAFKFIEVRQRWRGNGPGDHCDAFHLSYPGHSWLFYPYGAAPGTITHEAWHCIHKLLTFHGAELSEETIAYHLGYIVDRIYKFKWEAEHGNRKRRKPSSPPANVG